MRWIQVENNIHVAADTTKWDYEVREYGTTVHAVAFPLGKGKALRRLTFTSVEEAKACCERWETRAQAGTKHGRNGYGGIKL